MSRVEDHPGLKQKIMPIGFYSTATVDLVVRNLLFVFLLEDDGLGGGFKHVLFSPLFGEDFPFD